MYRSVTVDCEFGKLIEEVIFFGEMPEHKKEGPTTVSPSLVSEWASAHTARRCDGREEGCECGYYDLHRNLNNVVLLHHSVLPFSWCRQRRRRRGYHHRRFRLRCHHCRHLRYWALRCPCYHPGSGYHSLTLGQSVALHSP